MGTYVVNRALRAWKKVVTAAAQGSDEVAKVLDGAGQVQDHTREGFALAAILAYGNECVSGRLVKQFPAFRMLQRAFADEASPLFVSLPINAQTEIANRAAALIQANLSIQTGGRRG